MGEKNPLLKDGATPVYESPDGMRMYRLEDVEPGVLEEAQRRMETPEYKAWAAMVSTLGGPLRYAIADHPLPQGADAVVLRDSTGEQNRMIVVSRATASDRILSFAGFALYQDEYDEPALSGQKSILVWDDGRVAVNNEIKRINVQIAVNPGEAKDLLAREGGLTDINGIGKVRIVRGQ